MRTLFFLLSILSLLSCSLAQPRVPQWAKDAVWYQIFPERFRNGDPGNDPTRAELEFPPNRAWNVSPWTSDWYKLQPWEEKHSKNFYDNVFERRYGGDLQGIIDKLDYLADLGIIAIYFNPIFEGISLHKYDASTYHHIDRKSTRLNSSHGYISYAVFCLKKRMNVAPRKMTRHATPSPTGPAPT